MKLDFLIPASPTDSFCGQIAFFRLALDALGGVYRQARLVAVFGDELATCLPPRWKNHFQNIEIEWVDKERFRRESYAAQADRRYDVIRADADLAFLCDADTLLLRPPDELLGRLTRQPALAGVIAHYHFPWDNGGKDPVLDWQIIGDRILGRRIDLPHRYTLQPPAVAAPAPFYINYGLLGGTPKLLLQFYQRYRQLRPRVRELIGNNFCGQISLALVAADLYLPTVSLPMRYNFPNDPVAERLYPQEMDNIILMHYLRTTHFDRQRIFATAEDFRHFLSLGLTGSNYILQQFVRELTHGCYPFGE